MTNDTLNWIILDAENCASAFGPDSSHLLLRHRAMLDELHASGIAQGKTNHQFSQTGWNRFFAVDRDGFVRAAGSREHALAYMQPGYVLVQRQGCGKRIHVVGTNGGTVPCGARIKELDGSYFREYCGECEVTVQ